MTPKQNVIHIGLILLAPISAFLIITLLGLGTVEAIFVGAILGLTFGTLSALYRRKHDGIL